MKKAVFLTTSIIIALLHNSLGQQKELSVQSSAPLGKISKQDNRWQLGGIFHGKQPAQEILQKRTEHTKKFYRTNGDVDIIIGGPFHYKDSQGVLQDIDLNLKKASDTKYPFINEDNKFHTSFGGKHSDGVKMKYENQLIEFGRGISLNAAGWRPIGTDVTDILTKDNSIIYKSIYEDVNLEYEVSSDFILHKLKFLSPSIFSNIPSQQNVNIEERLTLPANSVLIDSLGIIKSDRLVTGALYVTVKSDTLFTIIPSRIWDGSFIGDPFNPNEDRGIVPNGFKLVHTKISRLSPNEMKLTALIPLSWLLDKDRVFPIVFDPTIAIGGSGSLIDYKGFAFRYPWRTNFWQQASQSMYWQSEINTAGDITAISYLQSVNEGLSNSNARIQMQTTSSSTFAWPTSFITSGWTTCYSGGTLNYTTGSGTSTSSLVPVWRTINLTTPFYYSNSQNLIIETRFQNSSFAPGTLGGWNHYARSGSVVFVHGSCDCSSTYPAPINNEIAYSYLSPVVQLTITPIASCSAPTIQANTITFSGVSSNQMTINWSNGNGTNRMVVAKAGSAIAGTPGNGATYLANSSFGSGSVLNAGEFVVYNGTGSSVTVTNLALSTTYFFRVYDYNCSPTQYLTSTTTGNPSSQATTASCSAPTAQASAITFSGVSTNQMTVNWSNGNGTNRIVVAKAGSAIAGTPGNGATYSANSSFGSGSVLNAGEFVVYNGTGTSVTVTNLAVSTTYFFRVFEYSCSPTQYLNSTTTGNPSSQATTASCSSPTAQANSISFTGVSTNQMTVNWTSGNGTNRIVVAKAGSAIAGTPGNGATYTANSTFGSGGILNAGEFVVYNGVGTSVTVTNLTVGTTYFFRVYEYSCIPTQYLNSTTTGNPSSSATNSTTTISITSSVIPPWQRENDSYEGSVTVSTTNPTGASWHLQVQVLNSSTGGLITTINYPSITTTTQNFFSTDPQLKANSIDGRQMKYYAILGNNSNGPQAGTTDIIEAQWVNKNEVYYNSIFNNTFLKIPLKYIPNTTSVNYKISRVSGKSSAIDNIVNGTKILSGNSNQFISLNHSNSNLQSVNPGVFSYQITYNGGAYSETGIFDLVKIGYLGNVGSKSVVVLVGGSVNIEAAIQKLPNQYNSRSIHTWSIAKDFVNSGKNTWYIATSNLNPLQKNAYNLGVALLKIKELTASSSPEISVLAHSKGGLEMRVMMDRKGTPNGYPDDFNANPTKYFDNPSIDDKLKAVIFLGTPHNDGVETGYITGFTASPIAPSSFVSNQLNNPQIINYFLSGTSVPPGIRIGNVSGYRECDGHDGAVSLKSSDFPKLNGINPNLLARYFVKEIGPPELSPITTIAITTVCNIACEGAYLYFTLMPSFGYCEAWCGISPDVVEFFYKEWWKTKFHHLYLTSSYVLNNSVSNSCLIDNRQTSSTLKKILSLINNNPETTCSNPLSKPCVSWFNQLFSSVLPNAAVSKLNSDDSLSLIAKSDENGVFELLLDENLSIGDIIQIEAPGIETISIPIDAAMLNSNGIKIPMMRSGILSQKIQFPIFKLISENPITNIPTIQIEVSSPTAVGYEIKINEKAFTTLNTINNLATIPLDTGSNTIAVKYKSTVDTVLLFKEVYYLPVSLFGQNTYNISISSTTSVIGSKVYVNNQFVKQIKSLNESIPVLKGQNTIMLSKFGFKDSITTVGSATLINASLSLVPRSYSSLTDSSIFNFMANGKIQYRKNVTLLDSSRKSTISLKQYDDSFSGKGLLPKSRKFEFRHLNSNWSNIRFVAVLDQIENLSQDSVYLMRVYDNTSFTKIPFNTGNVAGYDSSVQKLTYNYVNLNNGTAKKETLVIMKKQAPIVKKIGTLTRKQNETFKIPLSRFFSDPDSLRNEMSFEVGDNSFGFTVKIENGIVHIIPIKFWNGEGNFTLKAKHDGLWSKATVSIKIESKDGLSWTVFPNPTNGFLNIIGTQVENGKYSFSLKNTSGQTMTTGTLEVINNWVHKEIFISEFANGMYFLVLDNAKTKKTIKVVKSDK